MKIYIILEEKFVWNLNILWFSQIFCKLVLTFSVNWSWKQQKIYMVKHSVLVINFVLIQWFSDFFNLHYQNDEIAAGVVIKFLDRYLGRLIARGS